MCTRIDKGQMQKFRDEHQGQEEVTVHKVLRFDGGELVSPNKRLVWKPGTVKADFQWNRFWRNRNEIGNRAAGYVEHGIHALRVNSSLTPFIGCHCAEVIVEVKAKLKHLIGADDNQLAFSQVVLTQEEYDKAIALFIPKVNKEDGIGIGPPKPQPPQPKPAVIEVTVEQEELVGV